MKAKTFFLQIHSRCCFLLLVVFFIDTRRFKQNHENQQNVQKTIYLHDKITVCEVSSSSFMKTGFVL